MSGDVSGTHADGPYDRYADFERCWRGVIPAAEFGNRLTTRYFSRT